MKLRRKQMDNNYKDHGFVNHKEELTYIADMCGLSVTQMEEDEKATPRFYFLLGDELNECLDCGHESDCHAEYEVEGFEEAEVVCPQCKSSNYFIKDKKDA
jgi:hypothetical protein